MATVCGLAYWYRNMSLPLTDVEGVVQATMSGTPVSWNRGLGYTADGLLCVTSVVDPTDTYIGGWRVSAQGRLVVSQSTPEGQPWDRNAGWPQDKNTGAIITQTGVPAPTEPRIAGVAIGPLGGVYMTEGGFIWSPIMLFTGGKAGAWYDPSQLDSMWQDYTGTTPVAVPGTVADTSNPVGLQLDLSQGGMDALGPELVGTPSYIEPVWTNNGGRSFTCNGSGYLVFEGGVAGKTYLIDCVATDVSAGTLVTNINHTWDFIASADGHTSTILVAVGEISFYGSGFVGTVTLSVREIPGNHMLQSTSSARPLMSARVNLLQYTEDFTNGYWINATATVTPNYGTAPDGTQTSTRLQFAGANLAILKANILSTATPAAASCYIKGTAGETLFFENNLATSNLVTLTGAWQQAIKADGNGTSVVIGTYGGATARDVEVWHPQFELGLDTTTYQRVTTDSDYDGDPAKFPYYLKFDGVDDYLSTAAIDLTGTDKVTVFGGIYKGASPEQIVVELSTNTGLTQGAWYVTQPYNAASVGSAGLGPLHVSVNNVAAYSASVFTLQAEISADFNSLRVNGVNGTDATGDQGTGNYGNWPLFIGARSGPSFQFNGNLYSLVIGGALYDAATILEAETWVAEKTGVTL